MGNATLRAVFGAVAVVLTLSLCAEGGVETAPRTILAALSSTDGVKVSLSGVVVDKVVTNPPYIVVREPWSSEIRLIVLLDAPMALQRWQTVSVTGFMSTLVTLERALSAAAVSVYTDASGTTALAPLPILPGDQSFTPEEAPLQLLGRGDEQMLDGQLDPPTDDTPEDEDEWPCPQGTPLPLLGAKCEPDGATVSLTGKVVSAVFSSEDAFYVQDTDRAAGLRVVDAEAAGSMDAGDLLTFAGTMGTDAAGERYVYGLHDLTKTTTALPAPLTTQLESLGGAEWHYVPATGAGQMGAGGFSWGVNNIGLFVRVAGRVILTDGTDYYIDDGSAASSATGAPAPVRVTGFGEYIPLVGDFVAVEGVCGLTITRPQEYPQTPTPARLIRTTDAVTALATANAIEGTGGALAMPEGVPFRLEGGPVVTTDSSATHSLANGSQRVFYIQDATQGGAGVQVRYSGATAVTVGQPVSLVGTLATDDDTGEPFVTATDVQVSTAGRAVPPAPTALTAGGIGDSSTMCGFITAGATDTGVVSGQVDSVDTSTPPQFFYLKDSPTGTAYRVSWEWGTTDGNPIIAPCENGSAGCDGQKLVVYGVRSVRDTGTGIEPVIRVRTHADIKRLVGKYVAIGDSITHSGPAEGIDGQTYSDWAGKDWGMNASSQAMDYAHLIHRYLNNASASSTLADSTKLGAFGGTLHRLGLTYGSSTYLQTYMDEQPDLVTLQIGENETAALEGKARATPKNWPQNPAGTHFERFQAYTYPAYVPPEGGTIYECIEPYTESNSGNTPAADSAHWAARGSAVYTQAEEAEWKADYQDTYRETLEAILAGEPRPLVFCYGVWNAPGSVNDPCNTKYQPGEEAYEKEALMQQACSDLGVPFAGLVGIACPGNRAFGHTGIQNAVDWHPNDGGMKGYYDLFRAGMAGRIYGAGAPGAYCLDKNTIQAEWDSELGTVDVERRRTLPDPETGFTVVASGVEAGEEDKSSYIDTVSEDTRYEYRIRPWRTGIATGTYETETYKELAVGTGPVSVAALGPVPGSPGATIVYATLGDVVYASPNGGDDWSAVSGYISGGNNWPIKALFADKDGYVYASISNGEYATGVGDGKIYRSLQTPYDPVTEALRQVSFSPVLDSTGQSPLVLPDAQRNGSGSTSQWYHSWGFDQDTNGKLMVGVSSQETGVNNAKVFIAANASLPALPSFAESQSVTALLTGSSYRHMHNVLFDPLHGENGTWFVTYGDSVKRMAYSADGGANFAEVPRWRYGPYPDTSDLTTWSALGGYTGLTVGQSALLAGTDNYPADWIPPGNHGRRLYGNSILRSEDPFAQPPGGAYAHDIVLGFSPDEDAKAYGLKAFADGEVWLAMKDDAAPWKEDSPTGDNHYKDSTVWVSPDDGKHWRKLAVGHHWLVHDNPLGLPSPRDFGNIASAPQARIVGDYVFIRGSYKTPTGAEVYRLLRFRRLGGEE